jgi:hypothetical protein
MSREGLMKEIISEENSHMWMRSLVRIGAWVGATDLSQPVTAAVCLPRVEFSCLLTAVGACLCAIESQTSSNSRQELATLVGKRIAYSFVGNPYVFWEGVLCEPYPHDVAHVRIQGTQNAPPMSGICKSCAPSSSIPSEKDSPLQTLTSPN